MQFFYGISKNHILFLLLDCAIVLFSYALSFVICFYPHFNTHLPLLDYKYFMLIAFSYACPLYLFRAYLVIWGYSNIRDIYRLIFAGIIGLALSILLTRFLLTYLNNIQLILTFLFSSLITIFSRLLIRDYYSRQSVDKLEPESHLLKDLELARSRRILIAGAGEAGRMILQEYYQMNLGKSVIGFVDDDRSKIGKIFNGKPIIDTTRKINDTIKKYKANCVNIALPSAPAKNVERIASEIRKEYPQIQIKTLPAFTRIFDNKPLIYDLRDIGIEDLIGREEVKVDTRVIQERFAGKTALVTGAGGSIGSEICRQILRFSVGKIIALERDEFSVYELIKNLKQYSELLDYSPEIIYKIADIKDQKIMESVFKEHNIDAVFHAAAHKHVDLMESNEIEAVQNNIIGTLNILDLCRKYSADEFIFISTDKAVNPIGIMGATKRFGEILTLYYYLEKGVKSAVVRFGNVLGSRGSVIPYFCEQIKNGGPVTITHPNMTRYFMSITEASLLVINASAYSKGGETYVLDMGSQFKITDIAKKLIRLLGYNPVTDISIEYTGLRPGEKLHEELSYNFESLIKTDNEKIFSINAANMDFNKELLEEFINIKRYDIISYGPDEIRDYLNSVINEFSAERADV